MTIVSGSLLTKKELEFITEGYKGLELALQTINADILDINKPTPILKEVRLKISEKKREMRNFLFSTYGTKLIVYSDSLPRFNEEFESWLGRKFPSKFGEFEPYNFSKAIIAKPKNESQGTIVSSVSPDQSRLESTKAYLDLRVIGIIEAQEVKTDCGGLLVYEGTPIRRK